jgi:hypothetical protein
MTNDIRNYIRIVTEARIPYPQRQGNSVSDWKKHIISVMAWRRSRYGENAFPWKASSEEISSKMGTKAAEQLAAEGVITLDFEDHHISATLTKSYFGRSGQIRANTLKQLVIAPGPNFPADSQT